MTRPSKRVLFIAFDYPPIGGVGVIRTLKFSKYLPHFGWSPVVLTVRNRDLFYNPIGNDPIPDGVDVVRTRNVCNNLSIIEGGLRKIGIKARIFVPDVFLGWIPLTEREAVRLINEQRIDLIYTTSPPFTSAVIGARIKQKTRVRLVVDFRDAWSLNPYSQEYLHPRLREADRRLEELVLESADHIVTATEGIAKDYVDLYPFLSKKISPILNGFDEADFPTAFTEPSKFTITYTGYFYGNRMPDLFFKALKRILEAGLIGPYELQFIWAGRANPQVDALIQEYGLNAITDYRGLVPKKEADRLLFESHLLLFVIGKTSETDPNNTLTGKIFPYLASGRPLLALVPEGAAAEMILNYSDTSYIITEDRVDCVCEAILDAFKYWKSGRYSSPGERSPRTRMFRDRYNYREQTQRLAEIFDHLTKI